jgi:hypothetical protein
MAQGLCSRLQGPQCSKMPAVLRIRWPLRDSPAAVVPDPAPTVQANRRSRRPSPELRLHPLRIELRSQWILQAPFS